MKFSNHSTRKTVRVASAVLVFFISGLTTAQTTTPESVDPFYRQDRQISASAFDSVGFAKTFTHHKSVVNGIQVHYVSGGAGEPVLLIHGWPETWYSWRHVMGPLAKTNTVIAVDLPGFGDSQAAPSGEKKVVAGCLYEMMKSLGYPKFSVVGHDMGGPVTFALAALRPEAIQKLVFSETAIPGHNFADGTEKDILKITPQSVGGVWHFGFFAKIDIAEMLITGHERAFLQAMVRESYSNPTAFGKDELEELTAWLTSPGGIRGGLSYYQALFADAKTNQTEFKEIQLKMPILVLDGGDGFLQYVTSSSVGQVASDVKKVVVPHSGHFVAEERPGFVANEIAVFLKSKN